MSMIETPVWQESTLDESAPLLLGTPLTDMDTCKLLGYPTYPTYPTWCYALLYLHEWRVTFGGQAYHCPVSCLSHLQALYCKYWPCCATLSL